MTNDPVFSKDNKLAVYPGSGARYTAVATDTPGLCFGCYFYDRSRVRCIGNCHGVVWKKEASPCAT